MPPTCNGQQDGMDAPCLSFRGAVPPATRWLVPMALCSQYPPSFCTRFLLSHPEQTSAIKGQGTPGRGPQGHHRAPLLGPRLWHQCRCPDVRQHFLLCLFCLAACRSLGREGCWEGGKNGNLGDSFYLSCLGHGMFKSTGGVSWVFSASWNLSASQGSVRGGGHFWGQRVPRRGLRRGIGVGKWGLQGKQNHSETAGMRPRDHRGGSRKGAATLKGVTQTHFISSK